jgi:hypothetical protein
VDPTRTGDLDNSGKLCERYYAPLVAVAYYAFAASSAKTST